MVGWLIRACGAEEEVIIVYCPFIGSLKDRNGLKVPGLREMMMIIMMMMRIITVIWILKQ
jgi:hypothetical protein